MSALLRRAGPIAFVLSAALLLFAAACDDPEEDVPADSTTPDASVTASASITPDGGSATPAPSPRPTAPADWPEFTRPDDRISLRYPFDWYEDGGQITSYDPSEITDSPETWREGVEVETSITEARGLSGCGGSISLNEAGEVDSIDPLARQTTLAEQPAWEIVRENPDPPATLIHGFSLLYKGYCILLTAYYTGDVVDERTFSQIVESFQLRF